MSKNLLSVRAIQKSDIEPITQYWLAANPAFLTGMGVDLNKMPSKEEWITMLSEQLALPYPEKKSYCIIWLADNEPIGHCNVNKIKFGEEAYMHLHMWNTEFRKKGMGTELVKMSLPYFFENLELKTIYSEPYALNPAPNKTLEKAGFTFMKEFITIPGFLNFEQPVNLWKLIYEQYKKKLKPTNMQTTSKLNSLFIASMSLLFFACNSSKKEGPNNDNTTADTSTAIKPTEPPRVDMELATKRCFANDGLKYKTVVTMYTGGNFTEVTGNVASEEIDSNKKETTEFEGTISGDKLTIKFKGTPPVIGAASEWTDKPWRIEKTEGKSEWKEILHIVFNAKNYDTNKWADTDYQFVPVDCK